MNIRIAAAAALALVTLVISGCSGAPDDPRAAIEEKAATIDDAAQDVLTALTTAGLAEASATGRLEQCGGSLTGWGAEYHAGASAKVGESMQAAVDQVTAELKSLGWDHVGDLGGDFPTARLERGDVTIDLSTGGFTVGATRYHEDDLSVSIWPFSACVKLPEGKTVSDYAEFERSIPPRD